MPVVVCLRATVHVIEMRTRFFHSVIAVTFVENMPLSGFSFAASISMRLHLQVRVQKQRVIPLYAKACRKKGVECFCSESKG